MTGLIVAMSGGKSALAQNAQLSASMRRMVAQACWSPSATSTGQLGHRHRRRQRLRLRPAVGGHRIRAAGPGLPGAGVAAGAGHGPGSGHPDRAPPLPAWPRPPGWPARPPFSRPRWPSWSAAPSRCACCSACPAGRRGGDRRRHLRRTGADARQRRPPRTRHRRAAGHRGRIVRVLLFKANPAWIEVAQGVARTGGAARSAGLPDRAGHPGRDADAAQPLLAFGLAGRTRPQPACGRARHRDARGAQ